jgi:hypothetical protein
MIKTKGGSEFLYTISANYQDTMMRVSDKDIKILVKPDNDCHLMTLVGIYTKGTGEGKVFTSDKEFPTS